MTLNSKVSILTESIGILYTCKEAEFFGKSHAEKLNCFNRIRGIRKMRELVWRRNGLVSSNK